MAFSFTPESPVLNFGPHRHARSASRTFVLWPAWAYRVVAPRVRKRQLNVLQRAVLGLCRAGVFSAAGIAENLSIHIDLAAFLVTELSDIGHLDIHGGLTDSGLRVLADDAIETHEMVAGYVFQDPWTGDLWPRFVEQLDYSEVEYRDNGFPTLMLGTTGKPRRQWAFTVLPKGASVPGTPSAKAIVEAVSRHRKGLRFSDADEDAEEGFGDFVASGVQIDRVSFVEEEPQPVFLTTYLYVPESDAGVTDWYACDPFGLGSSVRLRRRVETIMQDMAGLYGVVNRLVGKTLRSGYEDQRLWLEKLELQAGLEVERRLTVNIRSHAVFDQILAMESARQEVRSLGDDCPDRKIDEVLRAGVKVLEASFSAMAEEHRLGDIWKRVYVQRTDRRTGQTKLEQLRDGKMRSAIYYGAFRAVGFEESIPNSFLNVTAGQVRSVADYGAHWRLRPLVTATALRADRDTSHPLRAIAAEHPGLLVKIDGVASLGGKAGHANNTSATLADAEQQAETVYSLVAILLGFGRPETTNSIDDGGPHGKA